MQKESETSSYFYKRVLIEPSKQKQPLQEFIKRIVEPREAMATYLIMTENKNEFYSFKEKALQRPELVHRDTTQKLVDVINRVTESTAKRVSASQSEKILKSLIQVSFSRALLFDLSNCHLQNAQFISWMSCPLIENLILNQNGISSFKALAKTNFSHLKTLSIKNNQARLIQPLTRARTSPCKILPPRYLHKEGQQIFRAQCYNYFTLYLNSHSDSESCRQNILTLFKMEPQMYKQIANTSLSAIVKLNTIRDKIEQRSSPLVTLNAFPIDHRRVRHQRFRIFKQQRSISHTIWSEQLSKDLLQERTEDQFVDQQNRLDH